MTNFRSMKSWRMAAFAALVLVLPAYAQDYGETVSAAMDAFRETRDRDAASSEINRIFAKALEAEEDGCINFCGFYLGMPESDASALAAYYGLKQGWWSVSAVPSTKRVFRMTFTLHGIRKMTKGGNNFDELSQAVASRIGRMKGKRDQYYDLIGYEYENIDQQRAFISEDGGLLLEDASLSQSAAAERAAAERAAAEYIAAERAAAERAAAERSAAAERAVTECAATGKVQLWEDGPFWAPRNVGAEEPWDYGLYFWWGDTVGKFWGASDSEDTPTSGKSPSILQGEGWTTATGVLAPEHDAAHTHLGGAWRMPTEQELADLKDKCDWTWTTMNGVNGYVIRGRRDYAAASIFLPAAGNGDGTSLSNAGSLGLYWSSVPYSDFNLHSWSLYFDSNDHYTDSSDRTFGLPVRPVQGFAE